MTTPSDGQNATLAELEAIGFRWERLRDVFPFGETYLSEGEYEHLVSRVLDSLPDLACKNLLIGLLDAQTCVLLEQLWVQGEKFEMGQASREFGTDAYVASNRLQIHSNLRHRYKLMPLNARTAMLNLPATEALIQRIATPLAVIPESVK